MHTVFQTRNERRTGLSKGMVLRPPAAREFQSPGGHLKGWLSQRLISVGELRDIQDVEYQQSTYCSFENVQSHFCNKDSKVLQTLWYLSSAKPRRAGQSPR